MKDTLDQLFQLMKTNRKLSPWVRDLTIEEAAKELKSEVDELLEALEKDDLENFKEELGDIINDCFLLLITCEGRKNIDPKEIVVEGINKLKRRKPHLVEGREVSPEEEKEVWYTAKAKEGKKLRPEEIEMMNGAQ